MIPSTRVGFSLIELVIVVTIIGIIAAIAVPRLSAGSLRAREAALTRDLAALRYAIDMYAAEHGGDYPGLRADGAGNAARSPESSISQLTLYSNDLGEVVTTPDSTHFFGPYVLKIPPLPVGDNQNSVDVVIDDTNVPPQKTGSAEGWVYNPVSGDIIANSDKMNENGNRTYDEY